MILITTKGLSTERSHLSATRSHLPLIEDNPVAAVFKNMYSQAFIPSERRGQSHVKANTDEHPDYFTLNMLLFQRHSPN